MGLPTHRSVVWIAKHLRGKLRELIGFPNDATLVLLSIQFAYKKCCGNLFPSGVTRH
jgi:hypothetical protein